MGSTVESCPENRCSFAGGASTSDGSPSPLLPPLLAVLPVPEAVAPPGAAGAATAARKLDTSMSKSRPMLSRSIAWPCSSSSEGHR
jgi:hypothetical protein